MSSRVLASLAAALLFASIGSAQTVRFDTNVGSFDMLLNPTGNEDLQGHVDNMLAYVNAGRYDYSVIHNLFEGSPGGKEDFILFMGDLITDSEMLPAEFGALPAIAAFDPLIVDADNDFVVDFDRSSLKNLRGTVSMLPTTAGHNTATSRFFVNLNDNQEIDPGLSGLGDLIPFAEIKDMATIDLIQALDRVELERGFNTSDLDTFNSPSLDNNRWVIIERAFVLEEPVVAIAAVLEESTELSSALAPPAALSFGSEINDPLPVFASLQAAVAPEPSSLMLAAAALMGFSALNRRRVRRVGSVEVGRCNI